MKRMHFAGAVSLAIVLRCGPMLTAASQSPIARVPSTPPSPVIQAWLDCVECTTDQLAAVAALGDAAVPALNDLLRTGPPQAKADAQRAFLDARWQKLERYATAHPEQPRPQARAPWVDGYVQRYVLLNRARAARALGAIKTPAARATLTQALQLPDLPDVLRRAINNALSAP